MSIDTKKLIQEIDTIRPMLQADGGDVAYVGFDEETSTVSLRLQGACAGCPGAQMTLKFGIEKHLRQTFPGINVKAV